ncbi:MAG TPA: LapA family protein [Acidimicrobiia bacterium]|nr:LapA family protein [Acidimicrobiia bacterium]
MAEPVDDLHGEETAPAPSAPPKPESAGLPWGGILAAIALGVVGVFAVQNPDVVSIRFLVWTADFPLATVILVTAAASVVMTSIIGAVYRRRRLRRRAEKEALKKLRSEG